MLEAQLVEEHGYMSGTPDDYEATGSGTVLASLLAVE
jgi:hypothetical protein